MQVAVERRPTLLLLIVLAVLFLFMSRSSQTGGGFTGESRTLFERSMMTVFSPVPKAVNWIGQGFSDIYHGYIDMRTGVSENIMLRRRVADLTEKNIRLEQSHSDLSRMRSILAYAEQYTLPTQLANIVMLDTGGPFKSLILDRGSDDNVQLNDAVVHPSGLVGRVVLTTRDLSKVQLVLDGNSAVGTLLERTRRQGVLRGDGTGSMQMYYVPSLTDVTPGDLVMTAGTDGIFPKGIPVARVLKVEEGKDLFKKVLTAPTVDFTTLEDVIILHTRKIPAELVRYPR